MIKVFKNLTIFKKFSAGVAAKPAEKATDKYGMGCGVESTPVGRYLNDCCVLNLDEKQDFLRSIMRRPEERKWVKPIKYNCGTMTFKRFGVVKTDGGACKEMKHFKRMGNFFKNFRYIFAFKNVFRPFNFSKILSLKNHFSSFLRFSVFISRKIGYSYAAPTSLLPKEFCSATS